MCSSTATEPTTRRRRRMVELMLANRSTWSTARESPQAASRIGRATRSATMLTRMVVVIFGNRIRDMLSGYRVFSRRFVKSFPGSRHGLRDRDRAHRTRARAAAADRRGRNTPYRDRPARLSKQAPHVQGRVPHPANDRAARQRGTAAPVLLERRRCSALTSVILAWPLLTIYLETGLVPRLPTADPRHGPHNPRVHERRRRPRSRYRDPWSAGAQPPALPWPARPDLPRTPSYGAVIRRARGNVRFITIRELVTSAGRIPAATRISVTKPDIVD